MKPDLETPSALFRSTVSRGIPEDSVDREGGDFTGGMIRRTSVITAGEALGHGLWIDEAFLDATADAINATGDTGVKARFTHPDASGDSLGTHLGRIKDARVEGGSVIADLHLAKSAHSTPDGDLAGYVMDLAIEDPAAFGQSISFLRDVDAEDLFMVENGAEFGLDAGEFVSPDDDNLDNLRHARLAQLKAVDTVDEPAANPDGMFHRGAGAVASEADSLLSYALGLSEKVPALTAFSIDPDRVRGFLARFQERHGIDIFANTSPPEPRPMSEDTKPKEADKVGFDADAPVTLAEYNERLTAYTERFGAVNGVEWLTAGKTWPEALELHADDLAEQLAKKTAQVDELLETIASLKSGEDAIDLGDPAAAGRDNPHGTKLPVRIQGKDE